VTKEEAAKRFHELWRPFDNCTYEHYHRSAIEAMAQVMAEAVEEMKTRQVVNNAFKSGVIPAPRTLPDDLTDEEWEQWWALSEKIFG
jgi:hypothetical protein